MSLWRDTIIRNAEGRVRTEDSPEIILQEFCDRHTKEISYVRMIEDFTITPDDKVNCDYKVLIWDDDLVDGKLPFKFGKVNGNFSCFYCKELTSLDGCPKEVRGNFICNVCGTKFTEEEVRQRCKVAGEIYV